MLLTHMYLWTNFLCISHQTQLVHLGCHSITKTKQGPFRVPPLIRSRELAGYVLGRPQPPEVDACASYWHRGLLASLLLDQGDGEEISPELKVRLDPQVPLTHHDEGRDVLDPIGVQVL